MTGAAARACLVLVVLLCVSFCFTRLAEVDFYWHLLEGRRILETGHVPRVDDLSYTSAGRSWVDLQWLFETLVAALHREAGPAGLDLLKIGLIGGGFVLAIAAALREAPPLPVAAFGLLAVAAAQERFTLRPEASTFLMLGALLRLLAERRTRPVLLFLAPLLLTLWANLHALYAAGLGALLLVAAGDALELRLSGGRRSVVDGLPPPRLRPLVLATCASVPATLLTPYGLAGWSLPWRLLSRRIAGETVYGEAIAEFRAPFAGDGLTASVAAFGLLALVTLVALLACPRGKRACADWLLVGAFLTLALVARRNIALFAIVALSVGPRPAAAAVSRARQKLAPGAWSGGRWLVAGLLAAAILVLEVDVVTNRFFARDATQRYFGRGEAPGFYPHAAADFILAQSLDGEVLNDLTSGGFLAWRWFPARRVFIDGRLEVHGEDLFVDALRLRQEPQFFERIAGRYGVTAVLWSHRESAAAAPLLRYLASGHGWRVAFVDLSAAVFVRDAAKRRDGGMVPFLDLDDPRLATRVLDGLRDAEARSAASDPLPAFLRRVLPRRDAPVAEAEAAIFFATIGRRPSAELLFDAALRRDPANPILRYDLGALLDQSGDRKGARRAYEEALALRPSYAPARESLALLLVRSGDVEGALAQWGLAERSGRLGPASLEARGALLARRGQVDQAIDDYRELLLDDPARSDARSFLALLYLKDGLKDKAIAEARRALALDPQAPLSRVALARIQAEIGDAAGAEQIYREVIARDASCGEARLGMAALLASTGRPDDALEELAAAVKAGIDPADLSREPAFRVLTDRPEFRHLLERAGAKPSDAPGPPGG